MHVTKQAEARARVQRVHRTITLYAHGIWRRPHEAYVYIYATAVPDRYLLHLCEVPGKDHISWETAESIAAILADTERKDGG